MNRKSLGFRGEEIAERFLRKQKFKVLDRNFHTRWGELDIVARDGSEIVFVEVKTRTSDGFARPEDSVNYTKQDHLRKAAQLWLAGNYRLEPPPCRFDVISVVIRDRGEAEIEHIKNAFM